MAEESPLITLRRAAMNHLARREHSFHELLNKLEQKYPDFDKHEQILPTLSRLRDEGLQSDQRFLESYIRFRSKRGFGPIKIEAELYHKGVDSSELRDELYNKSYDWTHLCERAFYKRYSSNVSPIAKEQQRYQRFLIQRGFSRDDIRLCLIKTIQ